MTIRRSAFALSVALLLAPPGWSQIPLGGDLRANSYTTGNQTAPAIASDAAGRFVVAWQSYPQDGGVWGVYAQRYDAAGLPLGGEVRVNDITTNSQQLVAVAADAAGGFVVAYASLRGISDDIVARRFDAAGTPFAEFLVNAYTTGTQFAPAVAMDGSGRFVVAWQSNGEEGSGYGVFAQRYDAAGVAQGGPFRVNAYTTGHQGNPAVAMDAAGNFVVAWGSESVGDPYGVFARRFNAAGAPLSGDFRVNTYTTRGQFDAAVAMDPAGSFLVAWTSQGEMAGQDGQDGSQEGVYAQRFDAAGGPVGPEIRVNDYTTSSQSIPSVAALGNDTFVVVWLGRAAHDDPQGIAGKRYPPSGMPDGDFQVNAVTTRFQTLPAVASHGSGRFVVAWADPNEVLADADVWVRRFAPDLIFGDGFDSGTTSSWSSVSADGGDLSVSASAALKGTAAGLQAVVDDTNGLFVQDDLPLNENRYRARFYFDTNAFDPGEALNHRRTRLLIVFEDAPVRRVAAVVLRRLGGAYSVMGRARLDDNTQANTGFVPISDGPHFVEIDWQRSSGAGANDGAFEIRVDGTPAGTLAGLDNSVSSVDFVRLGALSVKAGASGTLYFDEFQSRRASAIGP